MFFNPSQKKQPGILLLIKVSKLNEKGPLAAEQMLANLHGILRPCSYFAESAPTQEYVSFEMVCIQQNIHFFIWVSENLKEFVEGQIYAQYPDIEIEVFPTDYTLDLHKYQSIAVAELEFQKHYLFPLKKFEEFEEQIQKQTLDPLSGITEAIGKINRTDEQAWVQILFKPIKDKWWNTKAQKSVEKMQRGEKAFYFGDKKLYIVVNPVFKFLFAPFSLFLKLIHGLLSTTINPTGDTDGTKVTSHGSLSETSKQATTAILEKASKLGYRVEIRLVYLSEKPNQDVAAKLRNIAGSFKQFNTANFNGFQYKYAPNTKTLKHYSQRTFCHEGLVLNIEELASLVHLPNILVQTPNIVWVTSKKMEPPTILPTSVNTKPNELTTLGETNYRGYKRTFGIKLDDRRRHTYIVGKTGMGKSVLLENMIYSDMMAGRGVGVIDPHGELAETIISLVPPHRTNDVIIFDPSDTDYPVALNMLSDIEPKYRSIAASGFISVIKKMFDAMSWGPRLEYVLRNVILTLLEYKGSSMLGIMRILVDKGFREKVLEKVTDPVIKSFWVNEFEKFPARELPMIISPIQNKIGQFLSSPVVRNIVGQSKSTIDLRDAMDKKKILIVNLSKGKIGEDNKNLLGSMIITKFQIDAMSRANIKEENREDFCLFVDEFQNFATESFAIILSEARKYRLNLTMANQYVAQLEENVRDAVFGNVGSIITFQTGYDDALYLANQFALKVTENDILNLGKYEVYIRLLIDLMPSDVFSAKTLPPIKDTLTDFDPARFEKVIRLSRERYSHNKEEVEDKITRWSNKKDEPKEPEKAPKITVEQNLKNLNLPTKPEVELSALKLKTLIEATVTGVTNYGIFFNYKGYNGLIHKSEIPNLDILKPENTTAKMGTKIKCILIKIDQEKLKLAASLNPKQLG